MGTDPFTKSWWFLEAHDGSWLENAEHELFTRDPHKALKWPNRTQARIAFGSYHHDLRFMLKSDPATEHVFCEDPTPQPSAVSEEVREKVARIIDWTAFNPMTGHTPLGRQADALAKADAILSALSAHLPLEGASAPVPPGGWRPISEAPRDGTHIILAFGQDHACEGWYVDDDNEPRPWAFIDKADFNEVIINRCRDGEYGPSHWQPMPFREPRNRPSPPIGEGG